MSEFIWPVLDVILIVSALALAWFSLRSQDLRRAVILFIAFGLLLNDGELINSQLEKDYFIAGENCLIDNSFIIYNSRIEQNSSLSEIGISQISNFLEQFHIGLSSFDIPNVYPLDESDYQIFEQIKNQELLNEVQEDIKRNIETNSLVRDCS